VGSRRCIGYPALSVVCNRVVNTNHIDSAELIVNQTDIYCSLLTVCHSCSHSFWVVSPLRWAEVQKGTGKGKNRFKIRDLLADELCTPIDSSLPAHHEGGKQSGTASNTAEARGDRMETQDEEHGSKDGEADRRAVKNWGTRKARTEE